MGHEHRILNWPILLIAASLLLTGCAAPQPTIPTAVLYDRDRDEFSVEVEPVPEGQTPVYPEELGFVTLIDGERHEGLIPIPSAYNQTPQHKSDLWLGPYWVKFDKNSKWRIFLVRMRLPDIPDQDKPLVAECREYVYNHYTPPYPNYMIHIEGAHLSIPRD